MIAIESDMKFFTLYLLLAFSITLVSCDPERVYEVNKDLEEEDWKPSDTLSFDFEISDSKAAYNLYYNVRYSSEYPFYNLFTKYFILDSTGTVLKTPKLPEDMYLFDVKTGKSLGSGIANTYDKQISFLKDYTFPYNGKYTVKVMQYMRNKPLPGIYSFGLRVEKASSKQ